MVAKVKVKTKKAEVKPKKVPKSNFISVPEGVKVTIEPKVLTLEKAGVVQLIPVNQVYISIEKEDNQLKITPRKTPKRFVSVANTTTKLIKNAYLGFNKEFTYKLSVVYSHFPITVKAEGNVISILNFLGEKRPRKTQILPGVKVVISGKDITVSGRNLYNVSQTAGNMERTTRVVGRDYRIFDDGCYITERDI